MTSERAELAAIACDLRAHLEWLRECKAGELPPPPAAHRAATPGAPGVGSKGGPSLLDMVRAQVGPRRAAGRSAPPPPAAAHPGTGAPAPAARPHAAPAIASPARPAAGAGQPTPPAAPASRPPTALPSTVRTLEQIRAELGDCRRCKLAGGRRNLVYGVGNPRAELVFVGEGPGADEDAQGIPFVGRAGQLLTKMIEAMGFSRDEVYICNVVKCRPPGNRNPEPEEIAACEPFLQAQLASLQTRAIVTLGKFAAQTLLRDPTPITRLRGQWREYCGIPLMPTFHPAYLLRSPQEKGKTWSDLQQVMKLFGKKPPSRR